MTRTHIPSDNLAETPVPLPVTAPIPASIEVSEEDKALLAELNGTAQVTTPEGDAAAIRDAAAELKRDPLAVVVDGHIVVPLAKKTSAAMKKENPGVRGYAVTVEGEYYVASVDFPGKKMKAPYKIVVNLPSIEGALSVIKHKLLDKMLKMKYTGYISYRTHEITAVSALTPDTPVVNNVAYMDLPSLISFIASREIPIAVEDYGGDVKNLRDAVTDALLNPKDFKKREARRLADINETRELEKMNAGDLRIAGTGAMGKDDALRG